ncbi:MAG: chemotaxis protein CheC [Candidatus Hodarchaeales archaeon]|jgi:chemotaxis protein CheC
MHNEKYSFEKLSEFQLDALREVGNIGAGHAAVALTQFLNRSTYMSIPNVALDRVKSIHRLVKMPTDQDLAIISLDTVHDIKYSLLVFFDKESVVKIIDLMTTAPDLEGKNLLDLSPLFKSLIKETGSILLLKYVEALNYFLKANSFPSPPKLRFGSIDSLKDHELKGKNQDVPAVLVVECDIFTSKRNIAVDLAIVPHSETFDQFMKCLFTETG